jgi:dihydrofolate reductase
MIMAADEAWGIGNKKGGLPWPKIKEDMELFKRLTTGQVVVMGRKTWESLPPKSRPLPQRVNVVLTQNFTPEAVMTGAHCVYSSLEGVEAVCDLGLEVFIIGGAQVYKQALELDMIQTIHLSLVHGTFEADTHMDLTPYLDKFDLAAVQVYEKFTYARYERK